MPTSRSTISHSFFPTLLFSLVSLAPTWLLPLALIATLFQNPTSTPSPRTLCIHKVHCSFEQENWQGGSSRNINLIVQPNQKAWHRMRKSEIRLLSNEGETDM
ncbi:hypothetical protein EDC04DRAFT_2776092 [Pisolithus marmoratus]|nr:hypothetical protein EDC04DRAFT_2776092 [Pisolithus marmoratus]